MPSGAKRCLIAALLAAFAVSHFSIHFNQYYLGIAMDVGINLILAVSLNLINGHTGQFSLGHAGFMAVGGFTAAKIAARRRVLVWRVMRGKTPNSKLLTPTNFQPSTSNR